MTPRFTLVAALGFALAACDTTVVCGPNKYETDAGLCDCNVGFVLTDDGLECVALDGGASAATVEAGQQRDAGLDARSSWVPVGRDDAGELELDASDTDAESTASDGGELDAEADAASACVPSAEVCNGMDDDCDTLIDEEVSEAPLGTACNADGQGACAVPGNYVCVAGAPVCNVPVMPQAEVCDGIDNDCNNGVDDTFLEKGMTCTVGEGACANTGVKECDPADPTKLRCSVAPKTPTCGSSCAPMPTTECSLGTGDCKGTAAWVCNAAASKWDCPAVEKPKTCVATGSCSPQPAEVCDGVDNDCDGAVDEGVLTAWYPDCDADGYAVASGAQQACTKPSTPGCLNWMAVAPGPAAVDCDDSNERVYPGAQPRVEPNFVSTVDWRSYSGDTDCNGTVERSTTYDLATNDTSPFPVVEKAVSYPVCASASASCSNTLTNCYLKYPDGGGTAQPVPLSCGNSNIALFDASKCPSSSAFRLRVARLVCK